ncbi:unnamed protein product [Vicia faba]|uniref:Protein FAR1-RELATED SEQUENCE n=1 Tax=Vicia faba TaxID=3906 RepID=A0AAV1B465_VICFA|nr:unnamed protein product [Vicia faba]
MKGKTPIFVITSDDVAMRNAIRKVFPNSYYKLCACHSYEMQCPTLNEMVDMFGLEENSWINELYQKRKMWETTHIHGNVFAKIRTMSRCEAFHSHMGQFVHSKMNMTDFVKQFHRHANLVNLSKEVADLTHMDVDYDKKYLEYLTTELSRIKSKYNNEDVLENLHVTEELENILNLSCSKSKGCGPSTIGTSGRYGEDPPDISLRSPYVRLSNDLGFSV